MLNESEYNASKSIVTEFFGENWLNMEGLHPIQVLWNRQDDVAAFEIYCLGIALQRLLNFDTEKNTIASTVRDIKTGSPGEQRGILNEIIGASIISNSKGESAKLCPKNNKTFDCDLSVSEAKRMHISMKSFMYNDHRQTFHEKGTTIAQDLLETLKRRGIKEQSIIVRCTAYPEENDFSFVNMLIDEALSSYESQKSCILQNDKASIVRTPISQTQFRDRFDTAKIDTNLNSFIFQLSCPFFKNEVRNVTSKMTKAKNEIIADSKKQDTDVYGLFVKVNPLTKLEDIEKHFSEWDVNSDSAIDFIIVNSVFLNWNFTSNCRELTFMYRIYGNARYNKWASDLPENFITFQIPLGSLTEDFPLMHGVASDGTKIQIENTYVYSKGRIFIPTGTDIGTVELIANNIVLIPVKYYEDKIVCQNVDESLFAEELLIL